MRPVKTTPLLLFAAACASEPQPTSITRADLSRWEISPEPLLHLGVRDGDPNLQFFRISGLARLGDDRIVVANSGTQELRYFSADGTLLGTAGGRGEGPGEFKFLTSTYALAPDSLLAFEGTWRATYFDSLGTFRHSFRLDSTNSADLPRGLWLYRKNLVDGLPAGRDVEATKRFLARLPPPVEEPWYWYVRFDSAGYTWIADDIAPGRERSAWTIVDSAGTAVARARLPPSFRMFEATNNDVLGSWRDEDDIEYVRIYALVKPELPGNATRPSLLADSAPIIAGAELPVELLADIRGALRNMVSAQESYFADHRTYTTNRHDVELELPEGLLMDIISATGRGWFSVITGPALPVICGIAVGGHVPRGWPEGRPVCAEIE